MTAYGPVFLRWRAGHLVPEEERFETLEAALDAVEARWEALRDQAPQVLEASRRLLLSTHDLAMAMAGESDAATTVGSGAQ